MKHEQTQVAHNKSPEIEIATESFLTLEKWLEKRGTSEKGTEALKIPQISLQTLADLRDESRKAVEDTLVQEMRLSSNGIKDSSGAMAEPTFSATMKLIQPAIEA